MNPSHKSLEEYAASEPGFDDLMEIANRLALNYIADYKLMRVRRCQAADQCDKEYENNLLINKYFLLYEELSYAMNMGDIGRLETCLVPWIFDVQSDWQTQVCQFHGRLLNECSFCVP